MKLITWFTTPQNVTDANRRNYINVQVDAIGVGLLGGANAFLPIYLTRLGATSVQVGLLSTMPAVTGFLFAIILGRVLQRQRNIVPWFSISRLMVIMSFAFTGVVSLIVPERFTINAVLLVWALATIPQTILSISFSVVMNIVAGPTGRYELMTRRWSILGLTTSITVFIMGQLLDLNFLPFPQNYAIVFIGLSLGGVISYYFSSHLDLPELSGVQPVQGNSLREKVRDYFDLIRSEKPFLSFTFKRFIFLSGSSLALPLFPLYFVKVIHASDSWIATINMTQTAILVVGYFFWTLQSRRKGSRSVLLWTTAIVALYPVLTAVTSHAWMIAIYAGIAGIFQAGINLVFFDELMKTVPPEFSATFVSIAQSLEYMSAIIAPMLGSLLADTVGISIGLVISGVIRFVGFMLFLLDRNPAKP